MEDGRKAAAVGDNHGCPMIETVGLARGPHKGGPIKTGITSVKVNGKDAATFGDQCACFDARLVDMIMTGHASILISKRFAAREWDYTMHGGVIREGSANVFYGSKTDNDRIAMAIDRIRNSKFGQTEEGKKVVDRLEAMQSENKIRYAKPGEQGELDDQNTGGYYDPKSDQIVLNRGGPQKDDIDGTARDLTHEGTHAVIGDEEGRDSPNYVDKETRCWRNESELYNEQRNYAPGSSKSRDEFLGQKDQTGYIKNLYAQQNHPLPERPGDGGT
jgi:uncharacterized Zn-binding protein involved in type VI secretion